MYFPEPPQGLTFILGVSHEKEHETPSATLAIYRTKLPSTFHLDGPFSGFLRYRAAFEERSLEDECQSNRHHHQPNRKLHTGDVSPLVWVWVQFPVHDTWGRNPTVEGPDWSPTVMFGTMRVWIWGWRI